MSVFDCSCAAEIRVMFAAAVRRFVLLFDQSLDAESEAHEQVCSSSIHPRLHCGENTTDW